MSAADFDMCSHRLAMMDLVIAMTPYVDEASLTKTFALIRPYLEVRDKTFRFEFRYFEVTRCLCLDQGAGHAEEGVPRAGGDVRRRARRVSVLCPFQPGDAEGRPARNAEKRLFTSKEGEKATWWWMTSKVRGERRLGFTALSDGVSVSQLVLRSPD